MDNWEVTAYLYYDYYSIVYVNYREGLINVIYTQTHKHIYVYTYSLVLYISRPGDTENLYIVKIFWILV